MTPADRDIKKNKFLQISTINYHFPIKRSRFRRKESLYQGTQQRNTKSLIYLDVPTEMSLVKIIYLYYNSFEPWVLLLKFRSDIYTKAIDKSHHQPFAKIFSRCVDVVIYSTYMVCTNVYADIRIPVINETTDKSYLSISG